MKILVDASYINNSGGKILLETFLLKVFNLKLQNDFVLILDRRFSSDSINFFPEDNVYVISSNLFNRHRVFNSLIKRHKIKSIFCLNNLPPPLFFYNKSVVVNIYFHNLFYFKFCQLNILQRALYSLKRLYIFIYNNENYCWMVQNNSTKEILGRFIRNKKILIMPFYGEFSFSFSVEKRFDYIYVANNSPQKNLILLLDVWEQLGRGNFFPSLVLTVSDNLKNNLLLQRIEELVSSGINIINIGELSHGEIIKYYAFSKALIFPSKFESFGLPLIEGAKMGLPILASDKSFVHDIIQTSYLFDPNSQSSLFDCVKSTYSSISSLIPAKLKCENKLINLINTLYV